MAHLRKTIRENIKTTCTGLSTTGTNVYETRYFPLQTANLPAILIYTNEESIEEYTLGSSTRTQIRLLQVIIEAHAQGTSDIDDTLDTIAEEIEEAMSADPLRGGNANDTKLVNTEYEFDTGSQKIGLARFTYAITYATKENAVQTGI